ncbi:hypothetical protein HNR74_001719 [Flammeovirga kamogawensis]|nr:hypothetical protein [Flammeovirga kamogawensis]
MSFIKKQEAAIGYRSVWNQFLARPKFQKKRVQFNT